MRKNGVKTLLMGGQACVLYGAAEFSRDIDLRAIAWRRPGKQSADLLGLEDFVLSKKTQLDKDWAMIRRLVFAQKKDSAIAVGQ
jgi:hypothetical protein